MRLLQGINEVGPQMLASIWQGLAFLRLQVYDPSLGENLLVQIIVGSWRHFEQYLNTAPVVVQRTQEK